MSFAIDEEEYLAHYGILRRSGRYPWGSGGPENVSTNPAKRNKEFLDYVAELRSKGISDVDIATGMGIKTTQLRQEISVAKNQHRLAQITWAQSLRDKGMSPTAIGRRMDIPESTVRSYLATGAKDKADVLETTSRFLKDQVEQKEFLDVGAGVENHIGVSKEKLAAALAVLKDEGYEVHPVKLQQPGTGHETRYKILVKPGVTQKDVFLNRNKIQQITGSSDDGGRSFDLPKPPLNIDAKRVAIRYKEDGGDKADGVIYVRPGVEDVSLGGSSYAQVRIAVGGTHYLKGMAVYSNDLPDGYDLVFNTNKSDTGNKFDAMKALKDDPDNPFGAITRQILTDDKSRPKSVMNIVNEEGDWSNWAKSISAQALSKQSPSLAKTQLTTTYDRRKKEFKEISELTNPTVKKKLLESFADDVDSSAVHLKAAALPRSGWQVILPVESLPPTEIYAPNFRNGERVALIRYPHGGTFEIPELTVNNKHPSSRKLIGQAKDAVGIHPSVAERLSGADFDGDTVLVIPNESGKIRISPSLEGLKNFDPMKYKVPDGVDIPKISPSKKQHEMGNVSNLITDMTLKGAPHDEIARAVRHSMVVIDSEKHHLNWKQSEIDNGIKELKIQYQGGANKGASTIISRAKGNVHLPEVKERPAAQGGRVNRETGKIELVPTNRTRPDGSLVTKPYKRLAVTDDAFDLVSDANTPMERLYASHSNRLKSLANEARLEALRTPKLKYNPSAKRVYSEEVKSLDAKLALAFRNKPLERQALVIANTMIQARRQANPNMDAATLKKIKAQALETARARTGAKPNRIVLTQREWDAIQAGAISDSKLKNILDNADLETIKTLATPKTKTLISSGDKARAERMLADGYTRAEVASQLGVSVSTLDRSME